MRSLKIEPMSHIIKFIKVDESIILPDASNIAVEFQGRINELLLIFQEIMTHTSELDTYYRENNVFDESEMYEIDMYKDYIDFDIEESFEEVAYITYVFKYELDEEGKNIEHTRKERFNVPLTIRKAVKDQVFKMSILTNEQRIACINSALYRTELFLKSEPYEDLMTTLIASRLWLNFLRAHSVAIAQDFKGEVPFPAPSDWTPEKVILDAETFEIASCVYKILQDYDSEHGGNLNKLSVAIEKMFFLKDNSNPNSQSIRKYLGGFRSSDSILEPRLPANSEEIIEKISPCVHRFIDRDKLIKKVR